MASLLLDTDHESAVSPCCEVNEYVVALVATYSKAGYRRYPSLDMNVFTEHGRTPSLLFGAIEAVSTSSPTNLESTMQAGGTRTILRTRETYSARPGRSSPEYTHGRESNSPRYIRLRGTL